MPKEYRFRGYGIEELKKLTTDEFAKLLTSRERRTIKRGISEQWKKIIGDVKMNPEKFHKTHLRNMIIFPGMVGQKFGIYIGGAKEADTGGRWSSVLITPQMVGKRLGDFSIPVKRVKHSAPGIGASKSSKHIAVK